MSLKIPVKASSITNLTDGRYFAAAEVEWLGFNLAPETPHSIPLQDAIEIKGWLEGPRYVAEMGTQSVNIINETVGLLNINSIQVDNDIDFSALSPKVESVIRRIVISDFESTQGIAQVLEENHQQVAQFLLDFGENENVWNPIKADNHYISLEALKAMCSQYNIILQMNFNAESVEKIINEVQPLGIGLLGGNEIQVGMKAFDRIDPIIEVLELEDEF